MTGPSIRNEFNSTDYFGPDGEFKPVSCARDLIDRYPVATTPATEGDTMYLQNGRQWLPNGEQILRDELWQILGDAASRRRVNEAVRAARGLSRTTRDELLGLEPHKVLVENGIVDMLAEDADDPFEIDGNGPGTFTRVPVAYDSQATPERFDEFLSEVLHPDDVPIMWELIGYCLYRGYPYQKAFMFLGDGANGKSTLLAALREFLGVENVATAELQTLAEDRFAAADLDGKLANIAPDISDEGLEQTGTFKALTGGDRLRAERKYQDAYHFENHAKLIFSANAVPGADDLTHAYERRWLYFEFPNTFDADDDDTVSQEELLEAFRDEFPGILNVALVSFQDLYERGYFEDTVYMRTYDDAHERAINPAVQFVKDEIEADPDAEVRISRAYDAYRVWCREEGRPTQGAGHFENAVLNEYSPAEGKDPEDRRYRVWLGVRLCDDAADRADDADHADVEDEVDTAQQATF